MSQKRFLSWLGFNDGAQEQHVGQSELLADETLIHSHAPAKQSPVRSNSSTRALDGAESSSPVARIRELEAELADLRSRRDLTSLTKEEFEILAAETAVSLVRTAQARESRAVATSQKLIQESTRSAQTTIQSAEETARQVLTSADQRGKRVLTNAEEVAKRIARESEASAEQRAEDARRDAEGIINAKKREATSLIAIARKNAEELVGEASQEVAQYKNWLTSTLAESERLYRNQMNSLNGAHAAIEDAKSRLSQAFNSLKAMHEDIFKKADIKSESANGAAESDAGVNAERMMRSTVKVASKPAASKKSSSRSGVAKTSSAKKSAAKKSAAKKSATKKSATKKSATKKSATKR